MSFDIEIALKEIGETTYYDLHKKAAYSWASRSIAAYLQSLESEEASDSVMWIELANEFLYTASQHAAMVGDSGELLEEIRSVASTYRGSAMYGLFGDPELGLDETETESEPESESQQVAETTENSEQTTGGAGNNEGTQETVVEG